jgi:hypothetical protein
LTRGFDGRGAENPSKAQLNRRGDTVIRTR